MIYEKNGIRYNLTDPMHIEIFGRAGWKMINEVEPVEIIQPILSENEIKIQSLIQKAKSGEDFDSVMATVPKDSLFDYAKSHNVLISDDATKREIVLELAK